MVFSQTELKKNSGNPALLWLVLILTIAFALRLIHIGTESLWIDEGWSFYYANMEIGALLKDIFFNENNPPLYYVFLHLWIKLFGHSEAALRLPSAIFGSLLVFFNYKLGNLLYDRNTGLWCSFITAISLFYIEYSQEARVYMLYALLNCLSMIFYFRLQKEKQLSDYLWYILWSVLLLYSFVYALFILLAQNVIYFIQRTVFRSGGELSFRTWIGLQALVIFLAGPWLISYLIRAGDIQNDFWLDAPGLRIIIRTIETYALSSSSSGLILFSLLCILSFFAIQTVSTPQYSKNLIEKIQEFRWEVKVHKLEEAICLLIWLLVPISVPFFISLVSQPVYHIRYTIGSSIPFYVLVARGARTISRHNQLVGAALILFIVALHSPKIVGYYRNVEKQQWREAVAYIEQKSESGDLIILNLRSTEWTTYAYYENRNDLVGIGFPRDTSKVEPKHLVEFEEITGSHDRIWLLLSFSGDKDNLLYNYLKSHYSEVKTGIFKGLDLYAFEK